MLVESIAISAIILLMIFMFVRAQKKQYVLLAAPLLVTPMLNIAYAVISALTKNPINPVAQMLVLIIALAFSVVLMGLFSVNIKHKKYKLIYLVACTGFTTALTFIFLFNLYVV